MMEPNDKKILTYLYEAKANIFNRKNTPVSFRILQEDLGLTSCTIQERINALERERKVEVIRINDHNMFARITNAGMQLLESE